MPSPLNSTRPPPSSDNTSTSMSDIDGSSPAAASVTALTAYSLLASENSAGLVSVELLKAFETVTHCGLSLVLILIGTPSNILCLLVFAKQGLKDRINVLLFSVALAELLFLVTLLSSRIKCFMNTVDGENWSQIRVAYLSYPNRYCSFVTKLLMLLMTVDRCVTVTLPLKAANILTFRRMLVVIVFIYVAIFALQCPVMVVQSVQWHYSATYGRMMAQAVVSANVLKDPGVVFSISNYLSDVTLPLSVSLVVVCSVISTVVLSRASRRRRMLTSSQDKASLDKVKEKGREAGVTRMLLFLSFVYVVCALPDLAGKLTAHFVYDFFLHRKQENLLMTYYGFVTLLECVSSTVNFFAYVAMSRKFRSTLFTVLPPVFGRLVPAVRAARSAQSSGGLCVDMGKVGEPETIPNSGAVIYN